MKMTENEAIRILKSNFPKTCKLVDGRYEGGFDNVECEFGKALLLSMSALEEIHQYRAIGTVEECQAAVEKRRAKKPNKRADKYTDLIQHFSCPMCGKYFGQAGVHGAILFDKPKYCTCGQAIDWGETV